nr:IS630 family transposase [Rubrobacteraceae bacterium]
EEAYDEKRPVVCFDERPCQLVDHTREPLTMGEGRPARKDHEYERRGMAHLFVAFEPLGGWRSVEVHERRRSGEFAVAIARLAEEVYPQAEKIRLVVDNLNIHTPASFYEAFQAERARELCRRIEFVYTPVHGSWLNMVEVELSVLVRQCLRRRIPEAEVLRREAQAWERERNRLGTSADWRFTTDNARTKLRKLYPSIEP